MRRISKALALCTLMVWQTPTSPKRKEIRATPFARSSTLVMRCHSYVSLQWHSERLAGSENLSRVNPPLQLSVASIAKAGLASTHCL